MPPVQPVASRLPFSTKEPNIYQAEIVITVPGDSAASEQKYFTARDGEKRRSDRHLSPTHTLTVLELPEGKTLVLRQQKKCSAEKISTAGNTAAPQGEAFTDFLTNEWLAEKRPVNFEDLGKEELNGKQLAKFRVRYEKVDGVENISEAFIWVDVELGMPVKTEYFSTQNGQKINGAVIEFRDLKLAVDPSVFAKPEGCQNISAEEMQKILWLERLNAE